jgi:asparagine synthase (glutamine-hydrolysing)
MPGIVGTVSPEEREKIKQSLATMCKPLSRQPGPRLQQRIIPPFGLASVSGQEEEAFAEPFAKPFAEKVGEDRNILLAVVGEIIDDEFLGDRLRRSGLSEKYPGSLNELLLELYLECGVEALCGLNGLYLIVIWEQPQNKLTVINDRLGMQRLYYWLRPGRLVIASEVKGIACLPDFTSKVDQVALFDLCSAGHPFDDRTLFEEIRALPPASLMVYQEGSLSIGPYWDYRFSDPYLETRSEREIIDELAFWTREAVRKRVRKDTAILLTGGLDSRTIAGMYRQCAGGPEALTATVGQEGCSDVHYGREIAASLGYQHIRIPIDSAYLAEYGPDCTWITEGHMNVHGCWIFAAQDFIRRNSIRYLMTGLIGDALSGRHWSPAMMQEKDERKGTELILKSRQAHYPLLAGVFLTQVYGRVSQESLDSIRRSLEKAPTHHPLNKFDYMHFHQQICRHAVTSDIFKDSCTAIDPYTDAGLIDFWLRVPPELRAHGYLYKKMILSHLPEVRGLGYDKSRQPLDRTVYKENNQFLKFYERGRRLFKRKIGWTSKRPTGDSPTGCIHYNDWLRCGSHRFAMDLLNCSDLLEDTFDMEGVKRLVSEHMAGQRNEFKLIGALLTFALWRRQFCGDPQASRETAWGSTGLGYQPPG